MPGALSARFAAFIGQPAPLLEQAMAQRLTLDANEALGRGIVDGIMNRPRN